MPKKINKATSVSEGDNRVFSKYYFRKKKELNYSLVKRHKKSYASRKIKTEFDDDSCQSSLNSIKNDNFKPLMMIETDVLESTYSNVNNECQQDSDNRNDSADNTNVQNKDFHCSELYIKKELFEEVNRKYISNAEFTNENLIAKIKQEPLSPASNLSITNLIEYNDLEVQNEKLGFESANEHVVAKIKQEPDSQIFNSCTSNIMEECLDSPESTTDLSLSIKKELMEESCTVPIVSENECLSDSIYRKRKVCNIKARLNQESVSEVTSENNVKKKRGRKAKYQPSVSEVFNQPIVPSDIKTENIDIATGDSSVLNSESTTSNETPAPTQYKRKFMNPFCKLVKKVIVKEEELSEIEKEKIELEKDRRCEDISKRTGQKWRRAQIDYESSVENSTIPQLPDVITVFTPAGQKCELYPNFDRPDEFPTEADRKNWDAATAINISRNMWDIENGYFVPLGVDVKKEERIQNLREKAEEVYRTTPPKLSDSLFLTAENMFLKLDCWIKSRLPDKEDDVGTLMNEVICLKYSQFLFIKHPQILQTLIKMKSQDEYKLLRCKASVLYKKIQVLFDIPDSEKFEEYVFEAACRFRSSCGNMSIIEYTMLTPDSVDIVFEETSTDTSVETESVDSDMTRTICTASEPLDSGHEENIEREE